MEDSINVKKKPELVCAKYYLKKKNLEQKFSNPGIKQDKTKDQSSQCHLRLGHTKQHCDCGPCEVHRYVETLTNTKTRKKNLMSVHKM